MCDWYSCKRCYQRYVLLCICLLLSFSCSRTLQRLRGALELQAGSNAALAEMGEEGIDLLVDAVQLQMLDACWPMFAPPEEYVALGAEEGWEKMLQLGTGAQYLKVAQSPRNLKKRAKAAKRNAK